MPPRDPNDDDHDTLDDEGDEVQPDARRSSASLLTKTQ